MMSSSCNFSSWAKPRWKGSKPTQAESGHLNFQVETELKPSWQYVPQSVANEKNSLQSQTPSNCCNETQRIVPDRVQRKDHKNVKVYQYKIKSWILHSIVHMHNNSARIYYAKNIKKMLINICNLPIITCICT